MADAMTAFEMLEDGERWTDKIARYAMPIVLWCAQNGIKITYGDLEAEMIKRHSRRNVPEQRVKTKYGSPAGKIGNIFFRLAQELDEDIPPINAIIVNKKTELPGKGIEWYLRKFLKKSTRGRLSNEDRNALAEETIQEVFNYTHWNKVAKHLGYENLGTVTPEKDGKPIKLPKEILGHGGGGESNEHRKLKEILATKPIIFKEFGLFYKDEIESLLRSGDEVDILFENENTMLAVEVKTGNASEAELVRGIFQCVKYRATLRAMQLTQGDLPNAKSVLATPCSLTGEVKRLAKRLNVQSVWVQIF